MSALLTPDAPGTPAAARLSLADHVRAIRLDLPTWVPMAFAATAEGLERATQRAVGLDERQTLADLRAALRSSQRDWAQLLMQALAQAVDAAATATGPTEAAAAGPSVDSVQELTLMDDSAIDTDIALSRLVQVAELKADAALRDLAARCSRLRGLAQLDPDANPMRPAVVCDALRRASAAWGLAPRPRLELLRELALALGDQLVTVYARQLERLGEWGVEPSGFRRQAAAAGHAPAPARAGASRPAADALPQELQHALHRALDAVGKGARAERAPDGAAVTADALRRLSAAAGPGDDRGLPAPDEMMARLLALLLDRAKPSAGARRLIHRLDAPARRLAVSQPQLWHTPEHPLWQLLDRLASAGAVFDESDFGRLGSAGAALEQAVTQLEQAEAPDPGQVDTAVSAIDGVTTDMLGLQATRVAPQAEAMQARLAREDIERRVREQLAEQARPAWVPAPLRQFLVGPWSTALAHSAHTQGFDGTRFREQADAVEHMLALCRRTRSQVPAPGVFTRCLTHARLGLADAGLPAARVEAELADLERVLRKPWPSGAVQAVDWDENGHTLPTPLNGAPAAEAGPAAETPAQAAAAPDSLLETLPPELDAEPSAMGLHESLPTVPIGLDGSEGGATAVAERWLDSLEPGQVCRLSVQGRWLSVQLVWRSLDRGMFVFAARGAQNHTLPRSALLKLRCAGLAATIDRGQFIAQALGELAGAAAA